MTQDTTCKKPWRNTQTHLLWLYPLSQSIQYIKKAGQTEPSASISIMYLDHFCSHLATQQEQ